MDVENNNLPFVTVIIPVYNAEQHVSETLNALVNQSYPRDKFEIIVVDNGSTDSTLSLLTQYEVKLYFNRKSKNPYVSRNIGVEKANSDIIIFLDITCTPAANWLREGVKIIHNGADLVGGKIKFSFTDPPSIGEWYDSISFVNVEKYIREFKGSVAGNLFVKREVVNAVGLFPENGRSGMDMYWTRKATQKGFQLSYGENAEVYYPARGLKEVLKKKYRVGKGHILSWSKENKSRGFMCWETVKTFSPPSFAELQTLINNRGLPEMHKKFFRLWLVSWIGKIAMALGRTIALLRLS